MPRFRFSLRALLVGVTIAIAAFAAGMAAQRRLDKSLIVKGRFRSGAGSFGSMHWWETIVLEDGARFTREYDEGADDACGDTDAEPLF